VPSLREMLRGAGDPGRLPHLVSADAPAHLSVVAKGGERLRTDGRQSTGPSVHFPMLPFRLEDPLLRQLPVAAGHVPRLPAGASPSTRTRAASGLRISRRNAEQGPPAPARGGKTVFGGTEGTAQAGPPPRLTLPVPLSSENPTLHPTIPLPRSSGPLTPLDRG